MPRSTKSRRGIGLIDVSLGILAGISLAGGGFILYDHLSLNQAARDVYRDAVLARATISASVPSSRYDMLPGTRNGNLIRVSAALIEQDPPQPSRPDVIIDLGQDGRFIVAFANPPHWNCNRLARRIEAISGRTVSVTCDDVNGGTGMAVAFPLRTDEISGGGEQYAQLPPLQGVTPPPGGQGSSPPPPGSPGNQVPPPGNGSGGAGEGGDGAGNGPGGSADETGQESGGQGQGSETGGTEPPGSDGGTSGGGQGSDAGGAEPPGQDGPGAGSPGGGEGQTPANPPASGGGNPAPGGPEDGAPPESGGNDPEGEVPPPGAGAPPGGGSGGVSTTRPGPGTPGWPGGDGPVDLDLFDFVINGASSPSWGQNPGWGPTVVSAWIPLSQAGVTPNQGFTVSGTGNPTIQDRNGRRVSEGQFGSGGFNIQVETPRCGETHHAVIELDDGRIGYWNLPPRPVWPASWGNPPAGC